MHTNLCEELLHKMPEVPEVPEAQILMDGHVDDQVIPGIKNSTVVLLRRRLELVAPAGQTQVGHSARQLCKELISWHPAVEWQQVEEPIQVNILQVNLRIIALCSYAANCCSSTWFASYLAGSNSPWGGGTAGAHLDLSSGANSVFCH